jgi:hypothetical protein
MADLILRPSGRPDKPWSLQLRIHGPAETDYATLWRGDENTARLIAGAGAVVWLFGEPDAIAEAMNDG